MKTYLSAFALLLPLAGAGSALAADVDAAGVKCSVATLQGTYLFASDGLTVSGKSKGPSAGAGYEVYDGHGNVRGVQTISTNGKIVKSIHVTGKYTVNADCTSSVKYSDGTNFDQFLAPDGSTFAFIQTDSGTVSAGYESRATSRRVDD